MARKRFRRGELVGEKQTRGRGRAGTPAGGGLRVVGESLSRGGGLVEVPVQTADPPGEPAPPLCGAQNGSAVCRRGKLAPVAEQRTFHPRRKKRSNVLLSPARPKL